MPMIQKFILCVMILPAAAIAGDLQVIYPDAAPPPGRLSYFGPAAAPDCTGATVLSIGAAFDTVLIDSTTARPSLVDGYSCNGWLETGAEFVLGVIITEDVYLRAVLASTAELDIFLLDDCDSETCLAANISEFTALLPHEGHDPATPYWLVVDGYNGAEGVFSLQLSTDANGFNEAICDSTVDLVCTGEAEVEVQGDTYDKPDFLSRAECGHSLSRGGEVWYRISLQDTVTLKAELSNIIFDGVLWLFDGCDSDATCLAYANVGTSGTTEKLEYRNETGATRDYYLGIDSIFPIGTEQSSRIDAGTFTLRFECEGQVVATKTTSLGAVKSMFR